MKEFKFKIGNQDYSVIVEEQTPELLKVSVNGQTYNVDIPQQKSGRPRPAAPTINPKVQTGGPANVNSELPGTITKILVADGQHVKCGETLLVIESMKMANDIVSEVDGTVQHVAVTVGQNVNQGDLLVEMVSDFVAAEAVIAPKPAPQAPESVTNAKPAAPVIGNNMVMSPLPGKITKITVKVGDQVNAGDTVLLLEAMKMENSITTECSGKIKAIMVAEGDQVQNGQNLIELE